MRRRATRRKRRRRRRARKQQLTITMVCPRRKEYARCWGWNRFLRTESAGDALGAERIPV